MRFFFIRFANRCGRFFSSDSIRLPIRAFNLVIFLKFLSLWLYFNRFACIFSIFFVKYTLFLFFFLTLFLLYSIVISDKGDISRFDNFNF